MEGPWRGCGGEGTPAPNHLGDYTGRHFEESLALQTPAQGQLEGRQKAKRSRGGGDDRPIPMARGWSLDTT